MTEFTKYVGMDVHAATIAVAIADSQSSEVRFFGQIANTTEAMLKLVKQFSTDGAKLSFCYEAGPCGYGLHRQLLALGHHSMVVAPSLIPKKQATGSRPTAAIASCWPDCIVRVNSPPSGCPTTNTKRCEISPAHGVT